VDKAFVDLQWELAKKLTTFEDVKEALKILHARERELQDEEIAKCNLSGVIPGAEVWFRRAFPKVPFEPATNAKWLRGIVKKINNRTFQILHVKTGYKHAIPPQDIKLFIQGQDP
jgi:hypothetical protein